MPLNLKNLKNFKKGIYSVTPLQLCNARISGYAGTIVGCMMAMYPLILSRTWGWTVVTFFVMVLQGAGLVGEIQTKKQLKEGEQQIQSVLDAYNKEEAEKAKGDENNVRQDNL